MLSNIDIIAKLTDGEVGILPTDTLYGLVCNASLPDSVKRLYDLKNREQKPGTVIAASTEQLVELGLQRRYLKPVEHYWPNPISIVIPVGLKLPYLHQGKMSLAVRIPNNPELYALLSKTGPLLTSSANHPGEPPATVIEEARSYFGNQVDFYVEGGDLSGRQPSTVIKIIDDAVEVVREGAVVISEAGEVIKD